MSEAKHTPGPWTVETSDHLGIIWIDDEDGVDVCDLYHTSRSGKCISKQNAEANACLIAAAPELLECARDGWRMCNAMILAAKQAGKPLPVDHYAVRDLPKFAAAIAKAEGRS